MAECRVEKSLFETSTITEENIKKDLAVKIIHEMPMDKLEKIFMFIKKDMKDDPEFMHFHPDSELLHFAAKIYLPE